MVDLRKMKETDTILRIKADLDLVGAERQLRFLQPELGRIMKQNREAGLVFPKSALAIERLSLDFASSRFAEEMTRALRDNERLQAVGMGHALLQAKSQLHAQAETLMLSLHTAAEMARAQFALQMDSHWRAVDALKLTGHEWSRELEAVGSRMTEIARLSFSIPESALLHWPGKVLVARASLLEDCVLNTATLEKFLAATVMPETMVSPERLAVASQFVFYHADVVRRLPPRLPYPDGEEVGEDPSHRDEEVGAKLELVLRDFDQRLLELRRRAWRNLAGGGIAGARLAMAGIREVFTDILHTLAPDDQVKATAMWQARPKNIAQPTRRMRLDYILGEHTAAEADALLQFSESINRTQKFVHTFADDPELVRIQMAQIEMWIYLLLLRAKQGSRSS